MFVTRVTIPLFILGKAGTTALVLRTRICSTVMEKSNPQNSLHTFRGIQQKRRTGYAKLAAASNDSVEQEFHAYYGGNSQRKGGRDCCPAAGRSQ